MNFEELKSVKVGDKIEINGQVFTVLGVEYHPKDKDDKWHTDSVRIELEDNYVLEKEWGEWRFFQIITKIGRWLGFTTTKSKYMPLESLKVIL